MNTDRMERPLPISDLLKVDDFKAGKNLLIDLMAHKITMEEFDHEVACLALSCGFDELSPQPLPTRPRELHEYDMLSIKEKEELQKNSNFWNQPVIASYLIQRTAVINRNISNKSWLEELFRRFERLNDTVFAEKVRIKLNEFKGGSYE